MQCATYNVSIASEKKGGGSWSRAMSPPSSSVDLLSVHTCRPSFRDNKALSRSYERSSYRLASSQAHGAIYRSKWSCIAFHCEGSSAIVLGRLSWYPWLRRVQSIELVRRSPRTDRLSVNHHNTFSLLEHGSSGLYLTRTRRS